MEYSGMKRLVRQSLSLGLVTVLVATFSMVSLAGSVKPVGELLVSGSSVTVNGELAESGRTIFASSTIVTPEGSRAVLNLGKAGKLELAPGTTFTVNADGEIVTGDLAAGKVTLASSEGTVGVKTSAGVIDLNAGQTVAAGQQTTDDYIDKTTGKCIDADNDGKLECDDDGLPAWAWFAIAGGIAAAVVVALVVSGDDDDNVVSPVR